MAESLDFLKDLGVTAERYKERFVRISGHIYVPELNHYIEIEFVFPETDFSEEHLEELVRISENLPKQIGIDDLDKIYELRIIDPDSESL